MHTASSSLAYHRSSDHYFLSEKKFSIWSGACQLFKLTRRFKKTSYEEVQNQNKYFALFLGATSEYPATDTPSLNLRVRGWINIKLSATVVRSVLLKCYRGPQSRSGWISYGVSV